MNIRKRSPRTPVARDLPSYAPLHDLLLHEPSGANPAYVAKKRALLAGAGAHRESIKRLLADYEITSRHLREDAEVRLQTAEGYWRANEAIRRRDYEAAALELNAIFTIAGSPHVPLLLGAVEKKVRRRR